MVPLAAKTALKLWGRDDTGVKTLLWGETIALRLYPFRLAAVRVYGQGLIEGSNECADVIALLLKFELPFKIGCQCLLPHYNQPSALPLQSRM
jgi:hypothetical protein